MDASLLLQALITVAVTSLTGGVTNAVAIWMLFHPYEEFRVFFFRLHGAIPKNKARLAKTIGRTVGERLLTPEDLTQRLSAPQVRQAFDAAMHRLVNDLLEQEHGPLTDILPSSAGAVVDQLVADLGPRVAERLAEFVQTEAFRVQVGGWLDRLRNDLAGRPVGDFLTPARQEAIAEQVDSWAGDLADGEDMERTLRQWLEHQVAALEEDQRPLVDRLPPELLAPVEQAIHDYLPTAVDRMAGLLADPETRRTISGALRAAFDHAARQLLIHERILARLMVKDATFERLLDGLEQRGYERFTAVITAPAIRARVANALHHALLGLLQMPLSERLARMDAERRDAMLRTVGDWIVTAARSPATRASVRRVLQRGLEAAGERTWDQILALVPEERVAEIVAEAVQSEGGRAWIARTVERSTRTLLARPIGRPSAWLGPETSTAVRDGVTDIAWTWVQTQVPNVVERLQVPEMVEQKVLGFSTQRMEEIIRRVTDRELKTIVRLGYLLGALVGAVAFGLNQIL